MTVREDAASITTEAPVNLEAIEGRITRLGRHVRELMRTAHNQSAEQLTESLSEIVWCAKDIQDRLSTDDSQDGLRRRFISAGQDINRLNHSIHIIVEEIRNRPPGTPVPDAKRHHIYSLKREIEKKQRTIEEAKAAWKKGNVERFAAPGIEPSGSPQGGVLWADPWRGFVLALDDEGKTRLYRFIRSVGGGWHLVKVNRHALIALMSLARAARGEPIEVDREPIPEIVALAPEARGGNAKNGLEETG